MTDYLHRLMFALPLVCLLAAGVLIGWKRWQARMAQAGSTPSARSASLLRAAFRRRRVRSQERIPDTAILTLIARQPLSAQPQLCVIRFAGEDHLVGSTPAGVALLASRPVSLAGAPPREGGQGSLNPLRGVAA